MSDSVASNDSDISYYVDEDSVSHSETYGPGYHISQESESDSVSSVETIKRGQQNESAPVSDSESTTESVKLYPENEDVTPGDDEPVTVPDTSFMYEQDNASDSDSSFEGVKLDPDIAGATPDSPNEVETLPFDFLDVDGGIYEKEPNWDMVAKKIKENKNAFMENEDIANDLVGHYFFEKRAPKKVLMALFEANSDFFTKTYQEDRYPIHFYCEQNRLHPDPLDEDCIKYLINHGGKEVINELDEDGNTPLELAVLAGNRKVMELLLKNAENKFDLVNAKDGETGPLHNAAAASDDHLEVVKLLVELGSNMDAKNEQGGTPLHVASFYGHVKTVKYLIAARVAKAKKDREEWTPNDKDVDGWRPLHHAASRGHKQVVEVLVNAGAKVNKKDESARKPSDWASDRGHSEVTEFLQAWEAKAKGEKEKAKRGSVRFRN